MATAKENANPKLFSVDNPGRYSRARQTPLDWIHLGDFRRERRGASPGGASPFVVVPTTAGDKAVLRALADASRSDPRGVGLLRKAGLAIPVRTSASSPGKTAGSLLVPSCLADFSRPVFRIIPRDDDDDEEKGDVEEPRPGGEAKQNDVDNNDDDNDETDHGGHRPTGFSETEVSAEEIFDIIRNVQDPEHPNSLEQLGVVSLEQIELSLARDRDRGGTTHRNKDEIRIRFTPTIPHCSMATLIGLCLRVKLHRSLPPARFGVDVSIEPGTHVSEKAINKQLRDKERVRAALENKHLAGVVDKCIRNGMEAATD
ncbi:unnamed protein product [Pseudo-nitzschia multistriata]|uniref:Uncharacterized protein n=1 Tax=Pseudo-nitzschia multistriata TaxID=183589 RepID=A0A448ZCM6_9STRA|nr:unnamed protein product [Pseudo-nitzschia multistriata]